MARAPRIRCHHGVGWGEATDDTGVIVSDTGSWSRLEEPSLRSSPPGPTHYEIDGVDVAYSCQPSPTAIQDEDGAPRRSAPAGKGAQVGTKGATKRAFLKMEA